MVWSGCGIDPQAYPISRDLTVDQRKNIPIPIFQVLNSPIPGGHTWTGNGLSYARRRAISEHTSEYTATGTTAARTVLLSYSHLSITATSTTPLA